jgi:phospholipase/carboxylesterase
MLFLHNRGSNMRNFSNLADVLDHRYVYVFPNAPFRCESDTDTPTTGTSESYSWQDPEAINDSSQLDRSVHLLEGLVDDLCVKLNVHAADVVLGGFSEGAACALRCGWQSPRRYAGAAVLSIASRFAHLPVSLHPRRSMPLFLAHGDSDEVCDVTITRRLRTELVSAGHEVTYREYPIRHEISPRELQDLRGWLAVLIVGSGGDARARTNDRPEC